MKLYQLQQPVIRIQLVLFSQHLYLQKLVFTVVKSAVRIIMTPYRQFKYLHTLHRLLGRIIQKYRLLMLSSAANVPGNDIDTVPG